MLPNTECVWFNIKDERTGAIHFCGVSDDQYSSEDAQLDSEGSDELKLLRLINLPADRHI